MEGEEGAPAPGRIGGRSPPPAPHQEQRRSQHQRDESHHLLGQDSGPPVRNEQMIQSRGEDPRAEGIVLALRGSTGDGLDVRERRRCVDGDLLALRLIDWLRREKMEEDIARTPMQQIRRALTSIEGIAEGIESRTVRVRVDRKSGPLPLRERMN
jgi:hypothetical protein